LGRPARGRPQRPNLQHPTPHLLQLDRLERGTEITLTEAFVALALDDLEENRADDILRENHQQHTLTLARIAIDQDRPFLQSLERLAMTLHPRVHTLVIAVGRTLERHPMAAPYRLSVPLDERERGSLDRLLRILLGRATEMGPATRT
jgi:hypothetical protein